MPSINVKNVKVAHMTSPTPEQLTALDAAIRYFDNLIGDEPFARYRASLIELFEELKPKT
jgi:hypothetical protein